MLRLGVVLKNVAKKRAARPLQCLTVGVGCMEVKALVRHAVQQMGITGMVNTQRRLKQISDMFEN